MPERTPEPDHLDPGHPDLPPLAGSERPPAPGLEPAPQALDPSASIEITLILRRKAPLPDSVVSTRLSASDLASAYGADQADIDRVSSTLTTLGLEIVRTDAASRRVRVAGTVERLTRIFGTYLDAATSETVPE